LRAFGRDDRTTAPGTNKADRDAIFSPKGTEEAFVTRITTLVCLFVCLFALPLTAQEDPPRFELQSLTLGLRYRLVENNLGTRAENWSDHHEGLKLRLNLDRKAKYSLSAVALNGDTFTAGWNLRGIGARSTNRLFVKQLFVTAKPTRGVQFQYGGLPIVRGESSEITSYDNDGYMMGQRLTLSPKRVVDELTLTAGYLGDLRSPSVSSRWHRLDGINYAQVLVKKKLSERFTASADFTDDDGERTLRQGLVFKPSSVVESIRLEAYERVSGSRAAGGAITVEKPFGRTRLAATFASVDDRYRSVNSDRYGRGQRLSLTSTTSLGRDVSLQVFVTRALEEDIAMPNRTRVDVLIRYELADLLRQLAGD
jgi:hypothetical protein